jgi:hypothetical protein
MVRDMFYSRASIQNLTYDFLHDLITEAKVLVNQIRQTKTILKPEKLH